MATYKIKNKFYGRNLLDREIEYRGFPKKPPFLKEKGGGFANGKHLLETLDKRLGKHRLILTPARDEIKKIGRRTEVCVSEKSLRRINAIVRDRGRDIKLDATIEVLSKVFPTQFSKSTGRVETFRRGMLAAILTDRLDPRSLSAEDGKAVTEYALRLAADAKAAGFSEREAVSRKRSVQLIYLERLIAEFEARLPRNLPESDWQTYFGEKILYFQDNYIQKLEKINIATFTTQFPDFGVITADDYLDLIEIKLPQTPLLRYDPSHNSYYWSPDVSKAIAQVEAYIDSLTGRRADLVLEIEKHTGLRLHIVKPRGIVIAGRTSDWDNKIEQSRYFRLLNEGLKNVEVVPYDELSRRLRNTMESIRKLENASTPKPGSRSDARSRRSTLTSSR